MTNGSIHRLPALHTSRLFQWLLLLCFVHDLLLRSVLTVHDKDIALNLSLYGFGFDTCSLREGSYALLVLSKACRGITSTYLSLIRWEVEGSHASVAYWTTEFP